MENALRQINPDITLPYWDCTLESELELPRESSIFTESFMGNGDGFVRTGPFKKWTVQRGLMYRAVGSIFSPMDDHNISVIFSQKYLADISYPYASRKDDNLTNFELVHNNVHNWVGGEMDKIETAADDPIFFIYHCFIDYIYEKFREHQRKNGLNPETDWSVYYGASRHHLYAPMGLGNLMAGDGASEVFARNIKYTDKPSCSRNNTDCGTPYLWCNVTRERCVPWTKKEYENMEYVANQSGRSLHEEIKVHIEDRIQKGFQQLKEMASSSGDKNDTNKDNRETAGHKIINQDDNDTVLVDVEIAMIVLVVCLTCYAAFLLTCKCVTNIKDKGNKTPNVYNVNGHDNPSMHNNVIPVEEQVNRITKENMVSDSSGNMYNLCRASQLPGGKSHGDNTNNPYIDDTFTKQSNKNGAVQVECPVYENIVKEDVSRCHNEDTTNTTIDKKAERLAAMNCSRTNDKHGTENDMKEANVGKDNALFRNEEDTTSLRGKIFQTLGTEFMVDEHL